MTGRRIFANSVLVPNQGWPRSSYAGRWLYYFNARWYDPNLGRFINEDPARDGNNWYAYVGSNPLRYVDPTGLGPGAWLQTGTKIHQAILEHYKSAHPTDVVVGNNMSISSIIRAAKKLDIPRVAGITLFQPDILNLGSTGDGFPWATHYEVKSIADEADAISQGHRDRTMLRVLGLPVMAGDSNDPGVNGVVPYPATKKAPGGVVAFFSPYPGVVVYDKREGEQMPQNEKEQADILQLAVKKFDDAVGKKMVERGKVGDIIGPGVVSDLPKLLPSKGFNEGQVFNRVLLPKLATP